MKLDDRQRDCIAEGIAQACQESGIVVRACAIGHDHVHAVVARHVKAIEMAVGQFKGRATQAMRRADCHPLQAFALPNQPPPTPWAERCWSVFINDERQLQAAIDYVNRHPAKEGLAPQRWPFVTPV